jgi:hypothetical protein
VNVLPLYPANASADFAVTAQSTGRASPHLAEIVRHGGFCRGLPPDAGENRAVNERFSPSIPAEGTPRRITDFLPEFRQRKPAILPYSVAKRKGLRDGTPAKPVRC